MPKSLPSEIGPGRRRDAVSDVARTVQMLVAAVNRHNTRVSKAMGVAKVDLEAISYIERSQRAGEQITQGRLASELNRSDAAVSALVDRLVEAGHVARDSAPEDLRKKLLVNTPHARQTGELHFASLVEEVDAALASYTKQQLELVTDVLDCLIAATDAAHPTVGPVDRRRVCASPSSEVLGTPILKA